MNRKQRQKARAAELLQKRDVPAIVDHSDDPTAAAPWEVIRAFVGELFAATGEALPEAWPALPEAEFSGHLLRIRAAIEHLYAYIESQPQWTREDRISLRVQGDSSLTLLQLDNQYQESHFRAAPEVLEALARRPYPHLYLDQLYCTPDSSQRRILELARQLPGEGAKVLFLGDDDLGSLTLHALAHLVGEPEIHALDYDDRLLEHIAAQAPQIRCHKADLIGGGMPKEMRQSFDAVVLDPPWDLYHCWSFLAKAIYALKPGRHSRIYLSFCPLFLEHGEARMEKLWHRLSRWGLICESLHKGWHLYSLKDTEFALMLESCTPSLESPLLRCIQSVPYGFSNLYTLRRLADIELPAWRGRLFDWWHSA